MSKLEPTKSPNLPMAPSSYARQHFDILNNVFRLYFNRIDGIFQTVTERVTTTGITYPDGTEQTTAYIPSYIEAFDRTASIALPNTPTLLKPASFSPATAVGITYDPATGVFTFLNKGTYSLAISLNITTTNANQYVYVYAQKNTGSGWVNTPNSGKVYELKNGLTVQFVSPQAVYREAGEQTRYYIYSNNTNSLLVTQTLPGVSPTVYVPAIRIQFSGN